MEGGIDADVREALAPGGSIREWAEANVPDGLKTYDGKRKVTPEDVAVVLGALIQSRRWPNADGSMPTERAKALWGELLECRATTRGWSHDRWAYARDWLDRAALIHWTRREYVIGRAAGRVGADRPKGEAARWELAPSGDEPWATLVPPPATVGVDVCSLCAVPNTPLICHGPDDRRMPRGLARRPIFDGYTDARSSEHLPGAG
jgi:hypothetical protein